MFEIIETYFHSLIWKGLGKGYHLEPSKILLIMHMDNLKAGKVFSKCHGLTVLRARVISGVTLRMTIPYVVG